MKSAWLSKLPAIPVLSRPDGSFLYSKSSSKREPITLSSLPFEYSPEGAPVLATPSWQKLLNGLKRLLPFSLPLAPSNTHPMMMVPDRHLIKEQIENLAESPFEKSLFQLKKKPADLTVSKAWAQGLVSKDIPTRESALSLFKAYLSHTQVDSAFELSPHTEMKILMFAPHLNEGTNGKALLYEALLKLPVAQILEFETALLRDFSGFSPLIQALILKQLLKRRKELDKDSSNADVNTKQFRKLFKSLVVQFYTTKQESIHSALQEQEKIKIGFLKFQPVEEAYQKTLEEIERRYRLKLRQLKKIRSQKVAEADEAKSRRIELIIDDVEADLSQGLKDLDLNIDKIVAV